ncbi:hypothetical protein QUA54_33385 [Microcoleus sp. MOSTC5]
MFANAESGCYMQIFKDILGVKRNVYAPQVDRISNNQINRSLCHL